MAAGKKSESPSSDQKETLESKLQNLRCLERQFFESVPNLRLTDHKGILEGQLQQFLQQIRSLERQAVEEEQLQRRQAFVEKNGEKKKTIKQRITQPWVGRFQWNMNKVADYLEQIRCEQNACEAVRLKMQYYMHENLGQLKKIFWTTVAVMFAGFVLISFGVVTTFGFMLGFIESKVESQTFIGSPVVPPLLVTISGVVVEFIGATFLRVYRSTVEQAKDYITILDRINAGYMSLDLIKEIKCDNKHDQVLGEAVSGILSLAGLTTREASPPSNHHQQTGRTTRRSQRPGSAPIASDTATPSASSTL